MSSSLPDFEEWLIKLKMRVLTQAPKPKKGNELKGKCQFTKDSKSIKKQLLLFFFPQVKSAKNQFATYAPINMQYLYNKLLIIFKFYFDKGTSQNVDFHDHN